MKRINLLPKSELRDIKLGFYAGQFLVFWVCVMITLVVFLILVIVSRTYLTNQVNQTQDQISVQKQVLKSSDNELLKQQISDLNDQTSNIQNINAQHYYWSKALVELGNLLVPDIHLDLLTLDRATGQIYIKGIAGSRDSVLKFWSDVHKSAYFKNINFPLANLNQAADDSFEFTFYINPASVKQP